MTDSTAGSRRLALYYLASPLFLLLAGAIGTDVRVGFLEDTAARLGYYGLCFGGGLLAWRVPRAAPFVGLGESSAAFFLAVADVWTQVVRLPELAEGAPAPTFGLADLITLLLAGGIAIYSFNLHQRALRPS